MKIKSQPTNDNYRNNFDAIFKKDKPCQSGTTSNETSLIGHDPQFNNQDGSDKSSEEVSNQSNQVLKL